MLSHLLIFLAGISSASPQTARSITCSQMFTQAWKPLESLGFTETQDTWQVLKQLGTEIKDTEVVLTTSRSLHRASPLSPRLIYTDESQETRPRIIAFSLQEDGDPVLEIHDIDLINKTSNFYQVRKLDTGLVYQTNPRQCFHCHSHGRPLLLGLAQQNHWPFNDSNSLDNVIRLESRLSKWNNQLHWEELEKWLPSKQQRQLLKLALDPNSHSFWKEIEKYINKRQLNSLENEYFEQRHLFLSLMGLEKPQQATSYDDINHRLYIFLATFNAESLLEKLSLHVRPRNFQLSSDVEQSLRTWVKRNRDRGLHRPRPSFWQRALQWEFKK